MNKKKIIIGIVILVLVIAVSVLTTLVVIKNMDNDNDKEEKKPSKKTSVTTKTEEVKEIDKTKYEELAKEYMVALESKNNMDEFVDKYVDFEAFYVSELAYTGMTYDEVQQAYKEKEKYAKEDDYKEAANLIYYRFILYSNYDFDLEFKDVEVSSDSFLSEEDIHVTLNYKNKGGQDITFYFDMADDKIYDASTSGDTYGILDFSCAYEPNYFEKDDTLTDEEVEKLGESYRNIASMYSERELTSERLDEFLYTIIKQNEFYGIEAFPIAICNKNYEVYSEEKSKELLHACAVADDNPTFENIKAENDLIKDFREAIKGTTGKYELIYDGTTMPVFYVFDPDNP